MKLVISLALAALSFNSLAQESSTVKSVQPTVGEVAHLLPTIAITPFLKQGQDIISVIESDNNLQIAIAKTREAFDKRGFTTIDLRAKLASEFTDRKFTDGKSISDIQTKIISETKADQLVEVSAMLVPCGNAQIFRVILTAYDVYTGNSLANKIGESPCNNTTDIGRLAEKAIESKIGDFLNVLEKKQDEYRKYGVPVYVEIGFAKGAVFNMNSELGKEKLPLSDLIELWFEKNAFKNQYHYAGTSDLKTILDDVRIPMIDEQTGLNYNPKKFSLEIYKYLRSLGLSVSKVERGYKLYFVIK